MIVTKGIHKYYDALHVLKGIDLSINKGEIIAITGKSGAGKSTLLHILGTLDRPTEGNVYINDTDVTLLNNTALARFRNMHIGFIFQFHHLLPEFNALQNTCIPAFIHGTSESKALARGKELLDYLGLKDRFTHKPGQLSGGEQQRVAIARALINKPSIVLADEPTGNLDTSTSKEIHDLILQLRDDTSQTFVIVTHNTELAQISDRILNMTDGQISL